MTDHPQITVSLEKAKELRAAGWEQDTSTFVLVCAGKHIFWPCTRRAIGNFYSHEACEVLEDTREWFASPTAEEVLRELPDVVQDEQLHMLSHSGKWTVGYGYSFEGTREDWKWFTDSEDTLANASAVMWIYLKKNNLLPSPNV